MELKKCPFCGGNAYKDPDIDDIHFVVVCEKCWAQGPPKKTEQAAIKAWNNRSK